MTTAVVDNKKRILVPDARPGQVVAIEPGPNGGWTLVPVKGDKNEPFPPGSLLKYFDKERDELETALAKGCVQGPE